MAITKAKKIDPRLEEKKEEFLRKIEAPAAAKAKSGGPPIYLLAMLLILGVLMGVAYIKLTTPPPAPVPVDNVPDKNTPPDDIGYRTVQMTMVYSDKCKNCRQTNTIEELFRVRKIPYELVAVEADSNEGQAIVKRYGIESAPTAIIDATKLSFYPTTKADFGVFGETNGAYIVPEENLDDAKFYPSYFLSEVPGFCPDKKKPTIVQFDDFYSSLNTGGRRAFYNFTADFNQSANIKFSYTQTADSKDSNGVLGNIFLMCASEQGKYLELERAMAGIYCNNPFKGDETIITDPEIDGCWSLSTHYGTPLTQFELDVSAKRAGLDTNRLKECFSGMEFYYNNARQSVIDLGIRRAGTFLLDCRETASLSQLKGTFCAMHPDTANCKPAPDVNAAK